MNFSLKKTLGLMACLTASRCLSSNALATYSITVDDVQQFDTELGLEAGDSFGLEEGVRYLFRDNNGNHWLGSGNPRDDAAGVDAGAAIIWAVTNTGQFLSGSLEQFDTELNIEAGDKLGYGGINYLFKDDTGNHWIGGGIRNKNTAGTGAGAAIIWSVTNTGQLVSGSVQQFDTELNLEESDYFGSNGPNYLFSDDNGNHRLGGATDRDDTAGVDAGAGIIWAITSTGQFISGSVQQFDTELNLEAGDAFRQVTYLFSDDNNNHRLGGGAYGSDTAGVDAGAGIIWAVTSTGQFVSGSVQQFDTELNLEAGDTFGSMGLSYLFSDDNNNNRLGGGAHREDTAGADAGAAIIWAVTSSGQFISGSVQQFDTELNIEADDRLGRQGVAYLFTDDTENHRLIAGASKEDTAGADAGAAIIWAVTSTGQYVSGSVEQFDTGMSLEAGDRFGRGPMDYLFTDASGSHRLGGATYSDDTAGADAGAAILRSISGLNIIPPICTDQALTIPQSECIALMEFYDSTNGDNWTDNTGWGTDPDMENWYGVTLSGGSVSTLAFNSNNIDGTLPPEIGQLTGLVSVIIINNNLYGNIPEEFFNLVEVKTVVLRDNNISGELSSSIDKLTQIEVLFLFNNELSGLLPSELSNLNSLHSFRIENNNLQADLSGNAIVSHIQSRYDGIATKDISSQDYICNDVSLTVDRDECVALMALYDSTNGDNWTDNTGWGTDPDVEAWTGITLSGGSVFYLELSTNNLSGTLPQEIGNLLNIDDFEVQHNNIVGSIPDTIGNLTQMDVLNLRGNQLDGQIPSTLGNLTQMRVLKLEENNFSGLIPSTFSTIQTLLTFKAHTNNLQADGSGNAVVSHIQSRYDGIATKDISSQTPPTFLSEFGSDICADAGLNVTESDCRALEDTYFSLDGANWPDSSNRGTSADVNSWYGISASSDRVTAFSFTDDRQNPNRIQLKGTMPASLNNLTGLQTFRIKGSYNSTETASLTGLYIDIANMSNLTGLTTIEVNYIHHFEGDLANRVNLDQVTTLKVVSTGLSGDVTHIADMPIGHFDISRTFIGGNLSSFGAWTGYTNFNLTDNWIEGDIADLPSFPLTNNLSIGNTRPEHDNFIDNPHYFPNKIPWDKKTSGDINDITLEKFPGLSWLGLGNTDVGGSLDNYWSSRLGGLNSLEIAKTQVTGEPTTSPTQKLAISDTTVAFDLSNLLSSVLLVLADDSGIYGDISSLSSGTMMLFSAEDTSIQGDINALKTISNLLVFQVSGANLTGRIPESLTGSALTDFDVTNNKLDADESGNAILDGDLASRGQGLIDAGGTFGVASQRDDSLIGGGCEGGSFSGTGESKVCVQHGDIILNPICDLNFGVFGQQPITQTKTGAMNCDISVKDHKGIATWYVTLDFGDMAPEGALAGTPDLNSANLSMLQSSGMALGISGSTQNSHVTTVEHSYNNSHFDGSTVQNVLQRTVTGDQLGIYGTEPSFQLIIPAYTVAATYKGTITATLIEES